MQRLNVALILILCLVCVASAQFPIPVGMFKTPAGGGGGGGIAEVGSGSQRASARTTGTDPLTLAYPGSVTAGNLLIVAGAHASIGIDSITDTVGTTYTVVPSASVGGSVTYIAYGIAAGSGANTVSVDLTSANYNSFSITEFSGVNATPLDVNGGDSTGTSTTPLDSITTVATDALIIGISAPVSGAPTVAPGSGYTQFGEEEDWNNWMAYNAQFRIVTTATAYNVDWTYGTSQQWIAQTLSFKPV